MIDDTDGNSPDWYSLSSQPQVLPTSLSLDTDRSPLFARQVGFPLSRFSKGLLGITGMILGVEE